MSGMRSGLGAGGEATVDFWVERGPIRLHATVVGAGPTLLLHTGGLGDGGMWRDYLEPLAGFRLVLMDHRGRGLSSHGPTVADHHIAEYVADAAAVIEAVRGSAGDPVGFIGYSMGAQVGYALAAARPDLVAALVGLGGSWDPLPPPAGTAAQPASFDTDELVALLDRGGVAKFVDLIEDDEQLRLPGWLREQFCGTDAEQFRLSLLAHESWDPWAVVDQIACPTCLICGDLEDPDRTIGTAADRLPDATATWLPGLGHVGAYLAAEQVCAVVRPFLDRVLDGPSRG